MVTDKTAICYRILELVRDIQQGHRAANQFPDHALIIRDKLVVKLAPLCSRLEFHIVLGKMVEDGMIETGRTINDTYVRIA